MSEQSKDQLRLTNQQNFPNNNTGFITPDRLRQFNEDIIDTLATTADSASLASRVTDNSESIELLSSSYENFSGSQFNAFSSSVSESLDDLQNQVDNITTSSIAVAEDGVTKGDRILQFNYGKELDVTVNGTTASISVSTDTGSYATTGSNNFIGDQTITGSVDVLGDMEVTGTLTATTIHSQYESSSIIYSSGSTKFGDTLDDTHQFTGSVSITGSFEAPLEDGYIWVGSNGNSTQIQSSSLQGVQFPYTGSARITGSFGVTGSVSITDGPYAIVSGSGPGKRTGQAISNISDYHPTTPKVNEVVSLTEAEYAAITPDPNTLYVVSGSGTPTDGTSGTSGVSGTSGITGTSGTSGDDGPKGDNGTSGVNGDNGTSGVNGTSGINGTSGVDGTSGTAGPSGTNGTSGVDSQIFVQSDGSSLGQFSTLNFTGSLVTTTDAGSDVAQIEINTPTLVPSASFAITASYALNAAAADGFPYSGSAQITGSLGVTGSMKINDGVRSGDVITNVEDTYSTIDAVQNITTLTKAEYDAIGTPDDNTLYIISGSNISDGTSGTSGVSGTSGISGTNGTNGVDGTSGVNGTSGINGDNGTSGVNGTSGINGTSGVSPLLSPYTGSVDILGNVAIDGTLSSTAVAQLTSSWANNAISSSYALTASYAENGGAAGFPFSGSAQITGSLGVTGSMQINDGTRSGNVVSNVTDTYTSVANIDFITTLTQTEFDAIVTPDENTLYVISGSEVIDSTFPFSGSAQITGSLGVTGSITIDDGADTGSVVDNIGPNSIPAVEHVVSIDSASYAALGTKDPNTLYVVSGSTSAATLSPYTGSIRGNVTSVTEASNTGSLDFSLGNFFTASIDDDTHFNVTNVLPGQTVIVRTTITNATPAVTFSSNVLQPSGSSYTPSANGSVDVLTFTSLDSTNALLVAVNKFI